MEMHHAHPGEDELAHKNPVRCCRRALATHDHPVDDRQPRLKPTSRGDEHRYILLAEDDDDMRNLLSWSLGRRGYEVVECRNGYELYAQLAEATTPNGARPVDLVISDVRMPGIDGNRAIESLAHDHKLPPFILITAFGNPSLHSRARELGAVAVLDKPFEIGELLILVNRVLERSPP
jgi:two-component system, response regulator, stage 0 sporulation protein F